MLRLLLSLVATALAQPANEPGAAQPPQRQQVRFEDLPPAIRLGVRAEAVRRAASVIPVVVLVSDPQSYLEAIARWTHAARYPVLVDDGSTLARENIARFVRAFEPARVVRYSSDVEAAAAEGAAGQGQDGAKPGPAIWPSTEGARQMAIQTAMLRVWGTTDPGEFANRMNELKIAPPGVVIASAADPAWTGALALAAARAQPLLWDKLPGGINDEVSQAEADRFCSMLETACEQIGLTWRETGDALDAVTVCLNSAIKVRTAPDRLVALTDYVGRLPSAAPQDPAAPPTAPSRETGPRWAWCGQLFGNESEAAYRAMCSLFLHTRRAWLFDGYPSSQPWSTFDAATAADTLNQGGIETQIDDRVDGAGRGQWMRRVSRPLDAALVLVNTKGNPEFFDLEPGQCRPGDVPALRAPAAVYFVHSWSAALPGVRGTIAARWLERGAYAYIGSVQEPYLQSFVPTPIFAARMVSSFPWGAAPRADDGRAWRIAVFGDPLATIGPPAPRLSDADLPLKHVTNVADLIPSVVREKRYAEALALLTVTGRDVDAARLAAGLLHDDRAAVTPEVARAALAPLFREGQTQDLLLAWEQAVGLAGGGPELEPWMRDLTWLAVSGKLENAAGSPDERALAALRTNIRPEQPGADAAALSRAMAALYGRDAALGMLRAAREQSTLPQDTGAVDAAANRLMGGGGR